MNVIPVTVVLIVKPVRLCGFSLCDQPLLVKLNKVAFGQLEIEI